MLPPESMRRRLRAPSSPHSYSLYCAGRQDAARESTVPLAAKKHTFSPLAHGAAHTTAVQAPLDDDDDVYFYAAVAAVSLTVVVAIALALLWVVWCRKRGRRQAMTSYGSPTSSKGASPAVKTRSEGSSTSAKSARDAVKAAPPPVRRAAARARMCQTPVVFAAMGRCAHRTCAGRLWCSPRCSANGACLAGHADCVRRRRWTTQSWRCARKQ